MAPHLNAHLIGQPGGRWRINTPALVLDLDAFETNLQRMAAHCRANGLALRPHAKSHKSLEVARRQIAAGAIGQCCAKLGEAEALAEGGIESILITSPIVAGEALGRLTRLNARMTDLMLVVDSLANVRDLAARSLDARRTMKLLVDLDVGLHRTGVAGAAQARALALEIASHPFLQFVGLQGYAGHLMHLPDRRERAAASLQAMHVLHLAVEAVRDAGLAPRIVTGGGTGTFDIDPVAQVLTEFQAGSYAFMDRQYEDVFRTEGASPPFETSLFVQTTVISANAPGRVTVDAGFKSFATDAGVPQLASGAPLGSTYFFFGDEHGGVELPPHATQPSLGRVMTCTVPHCDPTVNLYEVLHVVREDVLLDQWAIEARGCSQ